jgi:ABC-type transport system involved in multi-copper enzyme maturation permease subunit
MKRLIKTELLKLTTIRTFAGILLTGLILTLIRFTMVVVSAGKAETPALGTASSTRDLLMSIGSGTILLLLFGVLAVTTEIRHGTIGWTFLATPTRWRVLMAKLTAVVVSSLSYLIIVTLIVVGLSIGLLMREGLPVAAIGGELWAALGGAGLGTLLYATLGVGLGAIIRHQIAAVMVPLGWFMVVENLFPSFRLGPLYAWLPGGATAALARADLPGLLPMWLGAVVLTGYTVAAVVIGVRVISTRDLT